MKVEGMVGYKSNSSSVFNIVVLARNGFLRRRELSADRHDKPDQPSLSGAHPDNRRDHDSSILKIVSLGVIRRLENWKSVKSCVSGFWAVCLGSGPLRTAATTERKRSRF
jgi:hypothetical protein